VAVLEHQGSGGADLDTLRAALTSPGTNWVDTKGGGHPLEATVSKPVDAHPQMRAAHPDTPAAENALVGVIGELRVAIIYSQLSPQGSEAP